MESRQAGCRPIWEQDELVVDQMAINLIGQGRASESSGSTVGGNWVDKNLVDVFIVLGNSCKGNLIGSGECFTKTMIDFKLNLAIAGHSCHCLLSPFYTGIGLSKDAQIMVTNLQNLHFLIVH